VASAIPGNVATDTILNAPSVVRQSAPVVVAPPVLASVASGAASTGPARMDSKIINSDLAVSASAAVPQASAPTVAPQISDPRLANPKVAVKVVIAPQRVQIASASVDGALGSAGGSSLRMPILVPRAAPVETTTVDSAGIAHHTVDVFSPGVIQRVRGSYTLVMDDHAVKLTQPLQDHDSVLCAPLRQIFESQGGVLDWYGKSKEVRATTATRVVMLKIGSRTANINGESTQLKTAPYISQNRTMIPVGFLPLALNVSVSYDPASGHLLIDSKG